MQEVPASEIVKIKASYKILFYEYTVNIRIAEDRSLSAEQFDILYDKFRWLYGDSNTGLPPMPIR